MSLICVPQLGTVTHSLPDALSSSPCMLSFPKTKMTLQHWWHGHFPKTVICLLSRAPFLPPFCPSSSQATWLSPVPRSAGAEELWAQQQTWRQPGQGAQQGHVEPLEAALANTTAPAAGHWPKAVFADLPGQAADHQAPCLTVQLQIRQSCALQVLYRPFGKAALNLHRVTSCTGGLYSFMGYWSEYFFQS